MQTTYFTKRSAALGAGLLAAWLPAGTVLADQEASEQATGAIEEVVVIGRYRSAATDVVAERIESAVSVDLLDAASISRLGDSTVAAALRRITGVTVRDEKFVYVRGLGERFSSARLNNAQIPSPDLTRSVIPLDIFPADIIDSLAIFKGYSPELPAAFGGGSLDIRTTRIPDNPVLRINLNTGYNSESTGEQGWRYSGGSDDKWGKDDGTRKLPSDIAQALPQYLGSFSPENILRTLRLEDSSATLADARLINAELATALNRNVNLRTSSLPMDFDAEITGGYKWFLGEQWEVGVLAFGGYERAWRNRDRTLRRVNNPELNFARSERTIDSVNLSGSLNLGVSYTDDHEVGYLGLFLRNTEDEASNSITCVDTQFNDCFAEAPAQGRIYDTRYEQRDLIVHQLNGTHTLGDATLALLPEFLGWLEMARELQFSWYYSDAVAESDIPNETRFSAFETLDPVTGDVRSSSIRLTSSAGEFRFSELEDDVESYGWNFQLPIYRQNWDLTLGTGFDYVRKGRAYQQYSFGLGSTSVGFQGVAQGLPSEVFSDENIFNPATGIQINAGVGGFGTESYLAGQIIDAYYYQFDLLWNSTWRLSGGARWENFQQVAVPVNLNNFTGSRVPLTADELRNSAVNDDDWYPTLALTYIRPGFWADEFQLRLDWSQTVARPDLREISRSSYIDPLTEARVRGNPFLVPSDLSNYDIRGEWYWDNGDNFTIGFFYKDIDLPIETVQGGATEDNILFTFTNAETAWVYGVEIEGLKSLDFASRWVGNWISGFYVAGNITLSDSEIEIGQTGLVGNLTNPKRRLTQHSEWVTNLQLGYDSPNGAHGATLAFNSFGERILFAGINGFDDAYEQPFHSLDLTYSWFATDNVTVKFRLRNLLDEKLEVEQNGVKIIEQTVGMTGLLDLTWAL